MQSHDETQQGKGANPISPNTLRPTKIMSTKSAWKIMTRRKVMYSDGDIGRGSDKIWNYLELASIGFGGTLGFGIYILIGHITHELTGPSAIVSFSIAGVIGILAALCFTEFSTRYPAKTGNTFNFIYSSTCEFFAFIIGWNLILEYMIGAACVSRAFTLYLDTLLNNTLVTEFTAIAPIKWDGVMAPFFDFVAFLIPIILAIALALGMRRYGIFVLAVTVINIALLLFLIILGLIKADASNWQIKTEEIAQTETIGVGGFMPFSITGTLEAVSLCVFIFIGFDSLSSTINKKTFVQSNRKIPMSFLISFTLLFVIYIIASVVFTLMWPYYMQSSVVWIPDAMIYFQWDAAKWVVSLAAMLSLLTSGFMFMHSILPIISGMANEGLMYTFLLEKKSWPGTPVWGILISGCISGTLAGLFTVNQLVKMLALGTLLMFTALAVGVILKRYSYTAENGTSLERHETNVTFFKLLVQSFNCRCKTVPTDLTSMIIGWWVVIYLVASLGLALMLSLVHKDIFLGKIYAVVLSTIFLIIMLIVLLGLALQPRHNKENDYFKVPLVPFLPGLAIFLNVYLLTRLDVANWIRFAIWMVAGLVVYFTTIRTRDHGVRNLSFRTKLTDLDNNVKIVPVAKPASSSVEEENKTDESAQIVDDKTAKVVIANEKLPTEKDSPVKLEKIEAIPVTTGNSSSTEEIHNKVNSENISGVAVVTTAATIQEAELVVPVENIENYEKQTKAPSNDLKSDEDLNEITSKIYSSVEPVPIEKQAPIENIPTESTKIPQAAPIAQTLITPAKETPRISEELRKEHRKSSDDGNSSTNSYDEINLIADVEDTLKEKKEPNGNTYFVEETKLEKERTSSSKPEDSTYVLAYLDDVINAVGNSTDMETIPISTSAIVHSRQPDSIPATPIETSVTFPPTPPPIPPPIAERSPKFRKIPPFNNRNAEGAKPTVSEENNEIDNSSKTDFIHKLTMIYGKQKSEEQTKAKTLSVKPSSRHEEPVENIVGRLQHSKSESNMHTALMAELVLKHDVGDTEDENMEPQNLVTHPPPPPPPPPPSPPPIPPSLLQEKLNDSTGDENNSVDEPEIVDMDEEATENENIDIQPLGQSTTESNSIEPLSENQTEEISASSTPIPPPPQFNPVLYDSMGKNTTNLSKSPSSTPNTSPVELPLPPQQTQAPSSIATAITTLKRTPKTASHNSVDNNDDKPMDRSTIVKKLELIFKQWPPDKQRKPAPRPPPSETIKPSEEELTTQIQEKPDTGTKSKNDTIKRRKLLFDDVLKSIKEEANPKPSQIRNGSVSRTESTDSIKSNLRHVTPQKQFLP